MLKSCCASIAARIKEVSPRPARNATQVDMCALRPARNAAQVDRRALRPARMVLTVCVCGYVQVVSFISKECYMNDSNFLKLRACFIN
jgi:hypothetical protein